ncbi:MAG: MFS transporter [Euryarchaeota archaeon]|nr:MFS transporter [Euryarchaeota archaeon]
MKVEERVLATTSLFHLVNDGGGAVVPALMPLIRLAFDLSYTEIGLLTAAGLVLTVGLQVYFGKLGDRRSARGPLAMGIILLGAGSLLVAISNTFWALFVALMIIRIGSSTYHPLGVAWLSRTYEGGGREKAIGINSSAGNVGHVFAITAAGIVGAVYGWNAPFILSGTMIISAGVLGLLLTAPVKETFPARTDPARRARDEARRFGSDLFLFAVGGAAFNVASNFGPLLFVDRYGVAPRDAALLLAAAVGTGVIGAYFYGEFSSRVGRRNGLIISYAGMSAAFTAMFLNTSAALLLPIMVFLGMFLFVTYPAVFSHVAETTAAADRGTAYGVVFALQLGGGALMASIAGAIADAYGIEWPFLVVAGLSLVSLAMFVASPRKGTGMAGGK